MFKNKYLSVFLILCLLGACFLTACSGGGETETAAWPEEGTQIEFSVEYSAGGGYDTVSRGLAPYIEKYLPGTTVSVVNMPGADGAIAAQYLYDSEPNGERIQILSVPGLVVRQLLTEESYDLTKYTLLGQVSAAYYVTAVAADSEFKTIDDLLNAGRQIKVGTAGVADTSAITAILAYSGLGIDFDLVPHEGINEAALSALRGDVDVVHGPISTLKPMIDEGQIRVLLVYTEERDPISPDTPTCSEIGHPELTGMTELKRIIAAAPDTPDEIKGPLTDAIWQAMNDPEFIAWGEETGNIVEPVSAEDTTEVMNSLFDLMSDNLELLQKYITVE